MRNTKMWLFGACVLIALAGTTLLVATAPSLATAQERELKDHWRYHDGHWNYWHSADKRWYHTDGSHWYYHDNGAWRIYPFDRGFGREVFERGTYRMPGTDVKIIVPRHNVYVPQ